MQREGIGEHVSAIIDRVVLQAKDGDAQTARLLLGRVLPSLKAIAQSVSLHLPADGSLTAKADALLDAAASADLALGGRLTELERQAGIGTTAQGRTISTPPHFVQIHSTFGPRYRYRSDP